MAKHTVVTDLRYLVIKVLREERKRQNISQVKLAELAGITKTTVFNMEQPDYNGSFDFTLAYMQALNINFTQLQKLIDLKREEIKTPVISQ